MPSSWTDLRAASTLLIGFVVSAPLEAQELSSQASVPISIRVQPSLAIRSVVPATAQRESDGRLTAASIVNVETNLPYRIAVRLPAAPDVSGVRVFVRNASGAFEPLVAGATVTAVVSDTPAGRGHEVVCRVETLGPHRLDAGRCPLVYELSAEHQDTLLRTSVIVN